MIKKILVSLLILVVLFLVVGLFLPSDVKVSRSVVINRPPSLVYATVNSFQLFPKWSPWQDLDPNMKQTTEGARDGVGAKLVWSGNDKVGSGTQTITASTANQQVDSDLEFTGMGVSKSSMSLSPADAKSTKVTWTVSMNMGGNPIAHYFGLRMDSMLGPDFASGLSKLKKLVEGMPDADIATLEAETVTPTATPALLVSESTAPDGIAAGYMDGFGRIGKLMAKNKLKQAGAPFGVETGAAADKYAFDAGIPVDRADVSLADGVKSGQTISGKALKAVHKGAYDKLGETRNQLSAYIAAHALESSGPVYYSFIDDPGKVAPAEVRTEIYVPIK